jgi:uncharacterized phage protein (TIGR01671 family)
MREIKFRVWGIKEREMEFVGAIDWTPLNERVITCNTKTRKHYSFQDNRFPDSFVLMQFTGLQDVNGKDIYEGDIIKPSDSKLFFVIAWDEKLCKFGGLHPDKEFGLRLNKLNTDYYTVIGNIYENPELIKEIK